MNLWQAIDSFEKGTPMRSNDHWFVLKKPMDIHLVLNAWSKGLIKTSDEWEKNECSNN